MKEDSGKCPNVKHENHVDSRKRRGRARNLKLIGKNKGRKCSQPGEGNRRTSPGSPESPGSFGPNNLDPKRTTPSHIAQD